MQTSSTSQVPEKQGGVTRFAHLGLVHQIIAVGFNALAQRLHPNNGGSDESLNALNEPREWLECHLQ